MNDNNNNQTPAQNDITPPINSQNLVKIGPTEVKTILINLFNKFYAKKKVFWPVTIFFMLILIIVILGVLFGGNAVPQPLVTKPSSSPFIIPRPTFRPATGVLGESAEKLIKSREFLDNLDVFQNRLKPPTLNYEVRF